METWSHINPNPHYREVAFNYSITATTVFDVARADALCTVHITHALRGVGHSSAKGRHAWYASPERNNYDKSAPMRVQINTINADIVCSVHPGIYNLGLLDEQSGFRLSAPAYLKVESSAVHTAPLWTRGHTGWSPSTSRPFQWEMRHTRTIEGPTLSQRPRPFPRCTPQMRTVWSSLADAII